MWKNGKFALTEKIFREIYSLVTSLVRTLLSRYFCQESVKVPLRFYVKSNLANFGSRKTVILTFLVTQYFELLRIINNFKCGILLKDKIQSLLKALAKGSKL